MTNFEKEKILDIGCGGANTLTAATAIRGNYNIDIRQPTIPVENFQLMNAEDLTFEDNFFDKVYLMDVLEHVEKPAQVLRHIHRVLKPGGKLILGTPNALYVLRFFMTLYKGKPAPHWDHIAVYSYPEMENLLRRTGFTNFTIEGADYNKKEKHTLTGKVIKAVFRNKMFRRQLLVEATK